MKDKFPFLEAELIESQMIEKLTKYLIGNLTLKCLLQNGLHKLTY